MYLSTILAITNFSVDGDYAVDRAAQLAVSRGAALELMYSLASSNPVCADHATPLAKCAVAKLQIKNGFGIENHALGCTKGTTP